MSLPVDLAERLRIRGQYWQEADALDAEANELEQHARNLVPIRLPSLRAFLREAYRAGDHRGRPMVGGYAWFLAESETRSNEAKWLRQEASRMEDSDREWRLSHTPVTTAQQRLLRLKWLLQLPWWTRALFSVRPLRQRLLREVGRADLANLLDWIELGNRIEEVGP